MEKNNSFLRLVVEFRFYIAISAVLTKEATTVYALIAKESAKCKRRAGPATHQFVAVVGHFRFDRSMVLLLLFLLYSFFCSSVSLSVLVDT